MRPKIGLKTYDLFYEGEDKIDFDVIEIIPKDSRFYFTLTALKRIKEYLKGKDLSMHTQLSRIFTFSENKDWIDAQLMVLKSEIIACRELGIKELIIHLKNSKLSKKEEGLFREVFEFAKKRNVELIYEIIGHGCDGKAFLHNLNKFPEMNCNFDLGHLNNAVYEKTLGHSIDEFISLLGDRIVYIHAHNNDGTDDQHKSLDEGTLDWESVLDKINLEKVRKIIIECKTSKDIKKTKELLEGYLDKRFGDEKIR